MAVKNKKKKTAALKRIPQNVSSAAHTLSAYGHTKRKKKRKVKN